MRFGFDDNLGLPPGVADAPDIEPVSFHDIGALLDAFISGDLDACFAPAGSIPTLGDTPYVLVAQAQVHGSPRLHSRMVMRRGDALDEPEATITAPTGYINEWCTTSYWAPMILLRAATEPGTALPFRPADGFDDLLAGVVEGRSDVAMVWDQVLARHPDHAAAIEVLGELTDLPAPIVYGRADLGDDDRQRLADALTGSPIDDPHSFFDGFAAPDTATIEAFARELEAVQEHFTTL